MITRREIKKNALQAIRRHYWLYLAACLLAALLGTEYANSIQLFQAYRDVPAGEVMEYAATTVGFSVTQGEQGIFDDLLSGNWEESFEAIRDRFQLLQGEDTYIGHVELGHSRGVLASLINQFSSGEIILTVITAIDTITGSPELSRILFVIVGLLVMGLFWVFIVNVYRVILRRVFLEGRMYARIAPERFTYLYRVRRWFRASVNMLLLTLWQYLWMVTLVGYPVTRYMYLLVPYLVAENPNLKAREALRLSRQMMYGHKWEACKLELTQLPLQILSFVTGGVTGILFSNLYIEAVFAEYYAQVRSAAFAELVDDVDLLKDRYLFEIPQEEELHLVYADTLRLMNVSKSKQEERKGFWRFMEKSFGIIPRLDARERAYRHRMKREALILEYKDALEGRAYPARLFPMPEHEQIHAEEVSFLRNYSLPVIILMFFLFCMFGWTWEVSLHLLQEGTYVNRGVLHGPWLPIYGCGGILILAGLKRLRRMPIREFFAIVVLSGVVEYVTSWALEAIYGQKWWDYSGYFLNLNGRICAEGLLVFGVGGMAVVYGAAPMIDNLLESVRTKLLWPLCGALLLTFCADLAVSAVSPNMGAGVTDINAGNMLSSYGVLCRTGDRITGFDALRQGLRSSVQWRGESR